MLHVAPYPGSSSPFFYLQTHECVNIEYSHVYIEKGEGEPGYKAMLHALTAL